MVFRRRTKWSLDSQSKYPQMQNSSLTFLHSFLWLPSSAKNKNTAMEQLHLPTLSFIFLLLTCLSSSSSTLDPKQIKALQSLGISTSKDPCTTPPSLCDSSKPFKHLLSLTVSNCSSDVSLSSTALSSLSTLQDLSFIDCPVSPIHFPPELISSLHSFSCVSSLRRLTGVWLSKLQNLTDLTVSDVPISASGPTIILSNLKKLKSVTISNANLTGFLPKTWHHNITHLDLSANNLKGRIRPSITSLENLVSLNLSSNQLSGELPSSIGDLLDLKNLSLSSNSLSGPIPEFVSSLVHLDLSSNQFNGSIPGFLAEMKQLKYLNLEGNNFQGVMPFNGSFIKKLTVFKIGENGNLCYNRTTISSKVKLGIAPCDKNGLPMSPPPAKSDSSGADESDYDSSNDSTTQKSSGHHGPNKVVLGIAIAFASVIFLIAFLIFLSKRCV